MLKLRNINKTFNKNSVNETVLFTDFSLDIDDGQFISIVGSNGSGKTTLLNILCGSTPIDGGSIFLKDKNITNMKEYKRSKFIGRVFQDPQKGTCPSMTILENMSMADNKGKPFNLTKLVSHSRMDYYRTELEKLKLGLEDKINVEVSALSGGQRQALALLMSTMTPVDVLILDEHTAALDPKTSENIMELTDNIVNEKKITTVMVTHNLRFAVEYGNRLMMMHKGNVIVDKAGDEKAAVQVKDLLSEFNSISIECGN